MKENKAITLISLVITIVIMLILATVSINLILGNNGLFSKSKQGTESYKKAEAKEQMENKIAEYNLAIQMGEKNDVAKENYISDFIANDNLILQGDNDKQVIYNDYKFNLDVKNENLILVSIDEDKVQGGTEEKPVDEANRIKEENYTKVKTYNVGKNIELNTIYLGTTGFSYNSNVISNINELPVGEYKVIDNNGTDSFVNFSSYQDYTDLTGNGYDLSLQGGAYIADDGTGTNALMLNGTTAYAKIPNIPSSVDFESGYEIEITCSYAQYKMYMWMYFLGTGEVYTNRSNVISMMQFNNTGDTRTYNMITNDNNVTVDYKTNISLNEKHTYKIVVNKNTTDDNYTQEMYLDGNLDNTQVLPQGYVKNDNKTSCALGYNDSNQWNFNGKIYNFKLKTKTNGDVIHYDFNGKVKDKIRIIGDNYQGEVENLTENGFDLSLKNGAKIVSDVNGDKCIEFDGTDDYGAIPTIPASVDMESGFTIDFVATYDTYKKYMWFYYLGNGFNYIDRSDSLGMLECNNTSDILPYYMKVGNSDQYGDYFNKKCEKDIKYDYKVVVKKNQNDDNFTQENYVDGVLDSTFNVDVKYIKNVERRDSTLGYNDTADWIFDGRVYSFKLSTITNGTVLNYNINDFVNKYNN